MYLHLGAQLNTNQMERRQTLNLIRQRMLSLFRQRRYLRVARMVRRRNLARRRGNNRPIRLNRPFDQLDVVWATQTGFPTWPAQILEFFDIQRVRIVWFDTQNTSILHINRIYPFIENHSRFIVLFERSGRETFRESFYRTVYLAWGMDRDNSFAEFYLQMVFESVGLN